VKVIYFALLRDIAGKREEDWGRPAANLGDLLHDLVAAYGPEFARWVFENGDLKLAIVLVNGRDVRGQEGLATALAPTDTVTIFPPVGGG